MCLGAHKIYTMSFESVFPLYVAKAKRKGRTASEVDGSICWLTGYDKSSLTKQMKAAENTMSILDFYFYTSALIGLRFITSSMTFYKGDALGHRDIV